MRLTRRGWGVIVVMILAVAMAGLFGARGLNAIVAPGLVGLVAAVVQVWLVDRPSVSRDVPARGKCGETIRVRLDIESNRSASAIVRDDVGLGLDAAGSAQAISLGTGSMMYDVSLAGRGEWSVGPLTVRVRDVFGLVETTFRYAALDRVIVQPQIVSIGRGSLVDQYGTVGSERDEFDQVRVYRRGDPVRDIHWKSSAKQPGLALVVKEFASAEGNRTVRIAGTAEPGCDDAMAMGVGSVSVALLRAGARVGVTTPAGQIDPGIGSEQERRILDPLATVGPGEVDSGTDPEVQVAAGHDGVVVRFAGQEHGFAELVGFDRVPESAESMAGGVA